MYYYLYDTFLSDKKYERSLDKIKRRLLDLEIQGKHERLNLLKNAEELISDEIKKGTDTIIVLGNDKTFFKVIDVIAKNNVTLGLIPIGEDNGLADSLGLGREDAACDILAARKVINFDLGKIDSQYFFSSVRLCKNLTRLSVEKDSYRVVPQENCEEVAIYNFYYPKEQEVFERKMRKSNPQDKKLELVFRVKPRKKNWIVRQFKKDIRPNVIDSIIEGNRFQIKSFEYLPAILDDYRVIKTPFIVSVEPKKLKIIVGKNRLKNID